MSAAVPTREEADDYPFIVARIASTRVIECWNRMQWVVQSKVGSRWRGRWFCRTKAALLRECPSHPALDALPERFIEPCAKSPWSAVRGPSAAFAGQGSPDTGTASSRARAAA